MSKSARWAIAFGYVGFIYATLGVIRVATNYLRNLGVLNLTVTCVYILVFGICVLLMVRRKASDWWRYIILISVLSSYHFLGETLHAPEEKIHFYEYGLVGILFFRAVESHTEKKWAAFVGSFILGSAAGWMDEVIQGFVPGRHYDPKDILINALSVALGLIILTTFPRPKKTSLHC